MEYFQLLHYNYSIPYIILLPILCYARCSLTIVILHIRLLIRLLVLTWRGRIWLCRTTPCRNQLQWYIFSYHALLFKLLLIDMHCNCTRTGFEVCACTASSSHNKQDLFHKLICLVRTFMREFFVVQCHPRNIFNLELLLNYGILIMYVNVHSLTMVCIYIICIFAHNVPRGLTIT